MKKFKLGAGVLLGRSVMKQVLGGDAPAGTGYCCSQGDGNVCQYHWTAQDAADHAAYHGAQYHCCDSCCEVGWLGSSIKASIGCPE